MRFTYECVGDAPAPASGYPLYICLHGGGGCPAEVNDGQWEHMKVYYRDCVDSGIGMLNGLFILCIITVIVI